MDIMPNELLCNYVDESFEAIATLETILELTLKSCFLKENDAIYYDISDNLKLELSKERNQYMNLLSIALEKVEHIKNINIMLESRVPYSKTPTIAADK